MNSAVVDEITLIVVNIIVADPTIDPPPDGCILVGLVEGEPCDIGWIYDPANNTFYDPNPPPPEEVEVSDSNLPPEEVEVPDPNPPPEEAEVPDPDLPPEEVAV